MRNSIYLLALITHFTCTPLSFINNKSKTGSLRPDFIKQIVDEFHPDIFIETGTYDGLTAKTASSYFKQVHTVELHTDLYKKAQLFLKDTHNATVYCGGSPAMINRIAPTFDGHILFWLDAHYSGENTAMSNENPYDSQAITPICQELRAIKESNLKLCTIMIDDIRGFGSIIDGTEFLGCWAYPSIQEICELGKEINPNFSFALLGDTLLMYDRTKFTPFLSPVVKACTASRLYNGTNLTDSELIELEKIIMNAQGDEKAFIAELYLRMTHCKDPLFHHDLWYGLTAMGSNNWKEALIALSKIPNRVEHLNKRCQPVNTSLLYNHWRIGYYLSHIKEQLN
jgi:hypothetical protein